MLDIFVPQVSFSQALLYLDPGTGGLLFSVIMGVATTVFFVLKGLFYKVRATLLGQNGQGTNAQGVDKPSLVIYSEGAQYASTFRPILQELNRRGIPCTYLSSDPSDPMLELQFQLVNSKCIGNGYAAWGQLNTLAAEVCLMTTPGLDVMQIKRSNHVEHYAHVIHSPTDKAFNRPYSFDYFDSVFICGPHQERTIRYLESLRNTPVKDLFMTGCVYYDEMTTAYRKAQTGDMQKDVVELPLHQKLPRQRVLLAPTWGRNGLLSRYGMAAITPLVEAGFIVVVRPHPQSRTSETDLLRTLQEQTKDCINVLWDEAHSPLNEMAHADLLLSDISGIVFDFAFLTGKPVLVLEFTVEKRGFEAADLPYEPWELDVLEVVGRKISDADLPRLAQIIQEETSNNQRKAAIAALREEYVQHFGDAAPKVVDYLEALLARTAHHGQTKINRAKRHEFISLAGQETSR